MAYCRNCGKEMGAAITCPHCGARHDSKPPIENNGGFLWGLLGCCIPIVGLILFLVWKDTKVRHTFCPVSLLFLQAARAGLCSAHASHDYRRPCAAADLV